jgi:hypothetical protein
MSESTITRDILYQTLEQIPSIIDTANQDLSMAGVLPTNLKEIKWLMHIGHKYALSNDTRSSETGTVINVLTFYKKLREAPYFQRDDVVFI